MKTVSTKWLKKQNACEDAIVAFESQSERRLVPLLEKCIAFEKLDWVSWLIVRKMTYKQRVTYAVFAAEQVLDNFERVLTDDNRPRLAIEAAKKCMGYYNNRSTGDAAWGAGYAARSAEYAAWSAGDAAWGAGYAARSAGDAAWSAGDAARSAEYAAWSAANAARSAGGDDMKKKILRYGISLLEAKS